ncbi:MAG: hypothetical protein ACP5T0_04455 [Verrucomicrobiia bacterium]
MNGKSAGRLITGLLIFGIASNIVYGIAEQDRYGAIVRRNAFNLREPEPPKPPPEPPPSIKVNLTGITTILSGKRAFFLVQEQGKAPESKMLKEGERDGQIEVISIDEVAGAVKVKIGDKERELTFKDDGIKPPTAPAAPVPAVPGAPPVPGIPNLPSAIQPIHPSTTGITPAGASAIPINPQSTSPSALAAIGSSMPSRQIRSGVVETAPGVVAGSSPAAVTVSTPAGQGVTLQMGGAPKQPKLQPNWPPENPVSPEEALIIHEANRIKYENEIKSGLMPPLPGDPIFK